MRRMFQRRYVAGAFALLVLTIVVGGWAFARSARASKLAADKIEARLGAPVRISHLSLGFASTGVNELRIYEREASPETAEPWVTVREADLDISPVSAIAGRSPKTITLADAQVRLRFNRAGDLITKLPAPESGGGTTLPNVRIVSGELTILQEGHPDSVFHGIDLTIGLDNGNPTVHGTLNDKDWGQCQIEGLLDSTAQVATLSLKSPEPRHITPELLERTPFVNPNAWKAVRLSGNSGLNLDLRVDLATEKLTYKLTMSPTETDISIPNVGLEFKQAHGELVAEGTTLKLNNVRSQFADGTVQVDSEMEFGHSQKDVLNFKADMANVDVKKLPDRWKIPDEIEGRLRAKLNFSLTIPDSGGVETDGRGEGVVEQVKFRGVPADPIHLSLKPSVKGGFKLMRRAPAPGGEDIVLANHEVLQPVAPPKKDPPAGQQPGLLSKILKGIANVVKPANAPKEEKAYLKVNISLTDVSVDDVLKSLKFALPIRLGGKASVKLQVEIPTETPNDFTTYRLSGTLTSPKLTVEDLPIENVKMKLRLRDGRLTIDELDTHLPGPDADSPAGQITGKGELSLDKDYRFSVQFKLDKVALERLDDLRDLVPVGIQLSGVAAADAKAEGTLKPLSVKGSGTAKITGLKVGPIPVGEVNAKWDADDKAMRFSEFTAKLFKGEVTGNLGIPFRPDAASEGNLKISKIDLGELTKSLPLGGAVSMEGTADGEISVKVPPAAEGGSRPAVAKIELRAPKLKLQNFPAEKIKVDARYNAGVVRYKLSGDALGGQFEVEGQYPPPPAKKAAPEPKKIAPAPKKENDVPLGTIRLKGVQLSKILEGSGLQNTLGPLDADIEGLFPLTTDAQDRLVGTGSVRATRIRFGGNSVALLGEGTLRVTPAEIRLEDFNIPVADGLARVSATFDRMKIDRSRGTVTFSNFPSDTLFFPFPHVAKWIKCKVDGSLTTTLGREWRGSGALIASQGTIYKIPVQEARFPLDWAAFPATGRGEIHIRDLVGSAARGRVTGRAEIDFFPDTDTHMSGELKFGNVNVSTIFQTAGGIIGSTPVSGSFTFSSDRLRSTDDIKALLLAKSGEATPFGLPVLAQATPLLGIGNNPPISAGELKTTLANGVWNIERLTLTGPSLDVYADGTITTSGRLRLNVAGTPGRLDLSAGILTRLSTLASQIVSQPLNPAGIQQILGIIGNFVIYLEVTGTTDTPQYRVQTIRTLSDAAVRFFVLRYVPIPH
ncbi:YhdP family protein [Zavarzinella formosa]|uniref:YhdP family protein n=1 Tax=Zavarzinella formosa TaxID=360055 RepID=UPI0002EAC6AD|nr:DUF3971 domain-containing protein [Zavarzinella formosa]